jgi:hypothetical protein
MREPKLWLVQYIPEAVVDFQAIQARKERVGILNAVDKLVALGPRLGRPHMKSLRGEPNLMELRPRQGRSPFRPIYGRFDDGFKILAIAEKSDFDKALGAAKTRASVYGIVFG